MPSIIILYDLEHNISAAYDGLHIPSPSIDAALAPLVVAVAVQPTHAAVTVWGLPALQVVIKGYGAPNGYV
jgi:hypothetical protein